MHLSNEGPLHCYHHWSILATRELIISRHVFHAILHFVSSFKQALACTICHFYIVSVTC